MLTSLIGTTAAGFELTRCVATSTRASLYEGIREGTRAAVKIYAPNHSGLDDTTQRNLREEQAQKQIDHPCVARAIAADRRGDGAFVLVSEWIDGCSLETRLAAGPLAWPEIIAILRDIARGLGAIHAAKVVHRDLKPSNIMLPASGSPCAIIVDFGHVLVIDDARVTGTGVVLGSAHYMAPEQAQGLPLDQRADLYAVGVILYRMLAGVLPFDHASPAEVMRMHQLEPIVPPHEHAPVPQSAEDLCLWLLAKNRNQRVPNAHVLRLTLEALDKSVAVPVATEATA